MENLCGSIFLIIIGIILFLWAYVDRKKKKKNRKRK